MKKAILAATIAMLTPANTNLSSPYTESGRTKEEIAQILSSDDELTEEELLHQARIKKLIPQIKEPIIVGDLNQPNVSITIDDGYGKENIENILDIFEEYDVKATFFVIGECLKYNSTLWKRAIQQGHEICNHTQTHSKYFKTGNEPKRFEEELLGWEASAKEVLGEDYLIKMKKNYPFFRFPGMHGIREKAYLDILKKHGYIPIGWWHTDNPKDEVVNNGDIFLWHFKNGDINKLRKSLELTLKNGKQAKTVSDIITSDEYDEPIGWNNVYKKKGGLKSKK